MAGEAEFEASVTVRRPSLVDVALILGSLLALGLTIYAFADLGPEEPEADPMLQVGPLGLPGTGSPSTGTGGR